ncbi:hypothetical protein OAN307_c31870 [Octadecabacter antarcticus 307]|uniref:HTH-like domain-containing protein n=1 Tax=Octadecabacter antarcticus 307 TaxID=391626 RepID=M9RFW2_9RHOB|nr:hypothetical protein OAN307_c31870 [Octadecabacter antarcticus 307]
MTSKRTFITAHKAQYAVSILCRLLEISRGWFYGFPASQPARDQRQVNREARDQELLPKIKTFFKVSKKCYGSKRIHQDLLVDSEVVSERRVARIMKENKVSSLLRKRRKPITTDSDHELKPSIAPSHTYCVCAAGNGQAIAKQSAERGQTCWNRSSTARRLIPFALSAMQSIACRVIGGRHHLYRHPLSGSCFA